MMQDPATTRPKVGFIGIGAMGAPMARNAMRAGFSVMVYDLRKEALEDLASAGAGVASSPVQLAKSSQIIITMLPSSASIREVVYRESGVLQALGKGHTFIEMSTLDVDLTLEIASAVEKTGASFLDCPVGGTPDMAEKRDLEIFASGRKESVEECMDLLTSIAKRVVYVGKAGNGKIIKLANNLLIALNKLAAIESVNVALRSGIDPDVILEVVKNSTGNSAVFERYGKAIVGHEGGYIAKKHSWHLKDLELVQRLCEQSEAPLFLGGLARRIFETASVGSIEGENLEALVKFYSTATKKSFS